MPRQVGAKWQGNAKINGERIRRNFDTELEALRFERNPEKYLATKTVKELFLKCYKDRWKGTKDDRNCERITFELIRMLGENTAIDQISTAMVTNMVEEWRETNDNTNATINRKLNKLSVILKFCAEEGHPTVDVTIRKYKEGKGRIRFFTEREEAALRDHLLNPVHKRFFDFLIATGCRAGEAMRLEWRDITASGNQRPQVTFWETKGGDPRTIPIPTKALAAIQGLPQTTSYVFADLMTYIGFSKAFDRAKAAAKLASDDQVVPHVLRHTCASRLVMAGEDLRRVKDWLGHKKIETTMRYAHLAPRALDSCADALDRLEAGTGSVTVPPVPRVDTEENVAISTRRRGREAEGGGLLNLG